MIAQRLDLGAVCFIACANAPENSSEKWIGF